MALCHIMNCSTDSNVRSGIDECGQVSVVQRMSQVTRVECDFESHIRDAHTFDASDHIFAQLSLGFVTTMNGCVDNPIWEFSRRLGMGNVFSHALMSTAYEG